MKLNKKKVLTVSLAISLVAILSFGTIAWFSDTDEVTNTFKVATSTEKPDDIFSVNVFERVDKDGDGVYDEVIYAPEGHTYEDILPGDNLGKKPTIRNTGSYDQYIRVKVTVNNASAWTDIFEKYEQDGLTLDSIFLGHDENEWTRKVDETVLDQTENTLTYVYYLNRILEPHKDGGVDAYLFTSVQIPQQLTQDDMATFGSGEFNIKIVAEAVQTENVGANAIEAFGTVMGQ